MTAPADQRRPLVDPRLRARRQEVRREVGRRRLRRVRAGGAFVLAGAALWAALASPLLDVDRVVVTGVEPDRVLQVEQAAGIELGAPLATLDLDRARRAIEALPWVDAARPTRSWPGTARISVSERQPVALARAGDGRWVAVDAERQLAVVDPDEVGALPTVVGVLSEARPGAPLGADSAGALELARRLAALHGGAVEVVVGAGGELDAVLRPEEGSEVRVRFGRPVELAAKVAALGALAAAGSLPQTAGPSPEAGPTSSSRGGDEGAPTGPLGPVVDLRVPGAPVIAHPGP